jgi:hypothetical protein
MKFSRGWPTESPAAIRLCVTWCPALAQCRLAMLSLPEQPAGVLEGLTRQERIALAVPEQARLERARAVSRNSERHRRMLDIAQQYQRDAYKADPGPRRALNNAWYAANSGQVKARARERYAAAKRGAG